MKVVINRNYKNMSFGKNNILINCPTINSYNNKHRKTLGGIESLVLSLADELSKRKFNITLSSSCKKTFIKNDISYVPIDKIKKNPQKIIFNSIISTNDATIFNDFKENQSYSFYGSCVGRRILGKKFIFVDVIECEEP